MSSTKQKQQGVTSQHQPQTPCSRVNSKTAVLVPLDLSFMGAADLLDLEEEEPRPLLSKKTQKTEEGKYVTSSVKLSNNMLQELKGLMSFLDKKITDPAALSWLDLSFNQLTSIEPTLCDLPNLQILYFHSNAIQDLTEVDKLSGMAKLRKMTLHGNPIENDKNYKWFVLSRIRGLTHLDFGAVTKSEKALATTWERSAVNKKKLRPKRDS